MPINKHKGETRDEFVSRCVKDEMDAGKPQEQALAICLAYADENFKSATASYNEPDANITFAPLKISFDYDETLSTERGFNLAKRLIDEGNTLYIISARRDKNGMLSKAKELGIPESRVYATGSNSAKVQKIKDLNIDRHYDNNADVVDKIPGVGNKFKKVARILFDEDFDQDELAKWKELGFKVLVRSKRKYRKADKKVWNKLKGAGLTEDALVFGEIKELHKRYDFEMIFKNDEDPVGLMLSITGQPYNAKKVLKEQAVNSIQECIEFEKMVKEDINFKFLTVKTVYVYEEIPGIPKLQPGSSSRKFCQDRLKENRQYTLDEISRIDNSHLKDMFSKYPGLEPSVFLYRGGFYRLPGTLNTTPWCRHQWSAKVIIER